MIARPTLIINISIVEKNISRMLEKVLRSSIDFRPHFKTHQSAEIGELFRKKGIDRITVSSVSMAEYFADYGWKDITIAFPVNLLEIEKVNALAGKIKLNLLVDSVYSTKYLSEKLTSEVGVFIEIDNGYQRSGLLPEQIEEISAIARETEQSSNLIFKGFLNHSGNTYVAKGKEAILAIMDDTAIKLNALKKHFIGRFPEIITSYGDTPSCCLADDLNMFDEIRPGNFVYFDVMQYQIGSCSLEDIAVSVACPVVSVYPDRKEIIIYGGAVHLSKDFIVGDNDFKLFGYAVKIAEDVWSDPIPGAYVSSITQEHGIVKMSDESIAQFKPGDKIGILPIHSCLTADLLKQNSIIR